MTGYNQMRKTSWAFFILLHLGLAALTSFGSETSSPSLLLAIDIVTTSDPGVGYGQRLNAVDRMKKTLHPGQYDRLYAFMARGNGEIPLTSGQLNALKNNIADVLLMVSPPAKEFGRKLIAMYEDERQDIVWRDYCIQFLGSWYPRVSDREEKAQIADTLWDAAEKTWSIAGTALLSLERAGPGPGIEPDALVARACELARDAKANTNARVTALQVAGNMGVREALDIAKDLLDSRKKTSTMLRVSALSVVGSLGDSRHTELIEPFRYNPDIRLRSTANAAVKRIQGRQE